MVGKIGNILTMAQVTVVQSIKNTQNLVDKVQLKLASGKDVNSAIDNPSNFFLSRSLSDKANDLEKFLDGISLNIETIKCTIAGVTSILKVIDQAEALLDDAVEELYPGEGTTLVSSLSDDDITAILAENPGVSYSPDSHSFYQVPAGTANFATADAAAQSATLIEPENVIGVAGVTGHLAVITSQLENDFINALTSVNAWLGGTDTDVEGDWLWVTGPESGQQFWQGTSGGSAVGGMYENWGGGEPNNSGNEDGVHMRPDGFWNDIPLSTNYNYVIEWDVSLFVTEADAALIERAAEYSTQYLQLLDQIDLLAKDTQYRGIQLLKGENLRTNFNVELTSSLMTEGINGTSAGLGLTSSNFLRLSTLNLAQEQVREARATLRSYSATLENDFSIISIRLDFTENTINVHKAASDELVAVDQNQAGAELLALQVRQQMQTEALRLSAQSAASVNQLFS